MKFDQFRSLVFPNHIPKHHIITNRCHGTMGCGSSRGTLAQRLEGLEGEAAQALVVKDVQKGLETRYPPEWLLRGGRLLEGLGLGDQLGINWEWFRTVALVGVGWIGFFDLLFCFAWFAVGRLATKLWLLHEATCKQLDPFVLTLNHGF